MFLLHKSAGYLDKETVKKFINLKRERRIFLFFLLKRFFKGCRAVSLYINVRSLLSTFTVPLKDLKCFFFQTIPEIIKRFGGLEDSIGKSGFIKFKEESFCCIFSLFPFIKNCQIAFYKSFLEDTLAHKIHICDLGDGIDSSFR